METPEPSNLTEPRMRQAPAGHGHSRVHDVPASEVVSRNCPDVQPDLPFAHVLCSIVTVAFRASLAPIPITPAGSEAGAFDQDRPLSIERYTVPPGVDASHHTPAATDTGAGAGSKAPPKLTV